MKYERKRGDSEANLITGVTSQFFSFQFRQHLLIFIFMDGRSVSR